MRGPGTDRAYDAPSLAASRLIPLYRNVKQARFSLVRSRPMPRISARLLSCVLIAFIGCKKEQGSGMVGKDAKGPIVIGEVGSMTGTEATFGTSSDRGIQLALTEVNASGGIKGRQVSVIALDDEGKPEEAATAATRLIASEH